ncbi:putative aldouronate transport system permease protein [Paenibacillus rhizosphaerae]|uniref:Putative aldouronate transport system permease protein n=1 Tax=Paenibacillus rhizosphaerae TaxID=297318 RepID=A0A839TI74_9BACL|nr:ABC transporter permease subunit [Paenibacillus rhizosphaerae]MBB3126505.1 putative aldouronate transport system permease protein [Paenibacillus rhizosphaerae]
MKKPNKGRLTETLKHIRRDRELLLLFIPCILFYIIFRYGPLYGLIIAFKDYSVFSGVMGSDWVGLKHFIKFFSNQDFWMLFRNTLLLGFYTLIFGFPFPILLAILLNEVRTKWFKKSVQTLSYLPAFLSVVIISSMIIDFLSPTNGLLNQLLAALGFEKKYFLVDPGWFRPIYVISEIWGTIGYESIIYLAAIAGINPTLYEAARVDGASRFHMIRHITIPGLMPTMLIMFILKTGSMIRIGYEKVLLLYNPMTYNVADVFSTYVYRKGLLESNYSYAAAVGMFEALVAMTMLLGANAISRKIGGKGLW